MYEHLKYGDALTFGQGEPHSLSDVNRGGQ